MARHAHDLQPHVHSHAFGLPGAAQRRRALVQVTVITLLAMVGELLVGWWSGSLALLADGWHMGTHALALGGAALAMHLASRAAHSSRFAFGGWKIEMLAAYTSALALGGVALALVVEAVAVLRTPRDIAYTEAMAVAALGLGVNLLCAWLLHRSAPREADTQAPQQRHAPPHAAAHDHGHNHGHGHGHAHDHAQAHRQAHGHGHSHEHSHGHHQHHHGHHHGAHGDTNFRAAFMHVLADALTSMLAILALAGGMWWGWRWLDPAVALLGAAVIARWAWGTLVEAGTALVDASESLALAHAVRERMQSDGDAEIADLHVWQVGPQAFAAVVAVVADAPLPPASYRARLHDLSVLRHVTVEVNPCTGAATAPPQPQPETA